MPQSNKILIIGSSGMLGADLCQELAKDYEVYGTDIVHSPWSMVHGFVRGDITDRKSIADIVDKIKPDIVIHAAAWTDVDGCELDSKKAYRINSEGTRNVAHVCRASDAIPIYISTDFVFDGRKKAPYKETDKTNPISVYGESKFKGEEVIKAILKRYYILRTSWLYGKHGKNFVDVILEKAKRKKALKVVNDQVGSPTYTKDLSKAIHVLLNKIFTAYSLELTAYGIYHVSNSGSVSWFEYAKEILRVRGQGLRVKEIIPISSEELARPAKRPAMSMLDNTKFTKFTHYRMRPWKDALAEYLAP